MEWEISSLPLPACLLPLSVVRAMLLGDIIAFTCPFKHAHASILCNCLHLCQHAIPPPHHTPTLPTCPLSGSGWTCLLFALPFPICHMCLPLCALVEKKDFSATFFLGSSKTAGCVWDTFEHHHLHTHTHRKTPFRPSPPLSLMHCCLSLSISHIWLVGGGTFFSQTALSRIKIKRHASWQAWLALWCMALLPATSSPLHTTYCSILSLLLLKHQPPLPSA